MNCTRGCIYNVRESSPFHKDLLRFAASAPLLTSIIWQSRRVVRCYVLNLVNFESQKLTQRLNKPHKISLPEAQIFVNRMTVVEGNFNFRARALKIPLQRGQIDI